MFSEKKNYVLQCCGAEANQSPSFLDIINGMINPNKQGIGEKFKAILHHDALS